jgi:hypothetical protein
VADLDRGWVSQYSAQDMGITITVSSTPTDADGAVDVTIINQDTQAVLLVRTATHVSLGNYQITMTPDDSAVLGNYQAMWEYTLSGEQKLFNAYFAIGGAEPAYDQLAEDLKAIVELVWIRMADMYDSPSGGPFLQTRPPTNFNRGRIAQLMKIAVGRMNTMAQPVTVYSIDGTAPFPTARWGPLLEQLTWVETLKHLRRSYLEQPDYQGATISRLDRQKYYALYTEMLHDEEANAKAQLDIFKISLMGLPRPSILVSGGAFGRYSSINRPYMAARPRMWFAQIF